MRRAMIEAVPGELDEVTIKRARALATEHRAIVEMRHNDRVIFVTPTTSGPDALRELRQTKASEKERPMVQRGDRITSAAEFFALPLGSEVQFIEGASSRRTALNSLETSSEMMTQSIQDQMPALVRVVGQVEPEWLDAAAAAMYTAMGGDRGWRTISAGYRADWKKRAKAAVAAADKARGIVNSREEFDALPADSGVVDDRCGVWRSGRSTGPTHYPCLVLDR